MRTESLLGTVAFLIIALVVGCTTTRTLPDGTVEVEQIDPAVLQAFVQLASAALDVAAATQADNDVDVDDSESNLARDMVAMAGIAQEIQLILADGITGEEQERLVELYEEAEEILDRNDIRLKLDIKKVGVQNPRAFVHVLCRSVHRRHYDGGGTCDTRNFFSRRRSW